MIQDTARIPTVESKLSHFTKLDFYFKKSNGPDQVWVDQHLCIRNGGQLIFYIWISSPSLVVPAGLCQSWWDTQDLGFLAAKLTDKNEDALQSDTFK